MGDMRGCTAEKSGMRGYTAEKTGPPVVLLVGMPVAHVLGYALSSFVFVCIGLVATLVPTESQRRATRRVGIRRAPIAGGDRRVHEPARLRTPRAGWTAWATSSRPSRGAPRTVTRSRSGLRPHVQLASLRSHVVSQIMHLEPGAVFMSLRATDGGALGESVHDLWAAICPDPPSESIGGPRADRLWLSAVKPSNSAIRHERSSRTIDDKWEGLILPSARLDAASPGWGTTSSCSTRPWTYQTDPTTRAGRHGGHSLERNSA
jgi:hypothetical protein